MYCILPNSKMYFINNVWIYVFLLSFRYSVCCTFTCRFANCLNLTLLERKSVPFYDQGFFCFWMQTFMNKYGQTFMAKPKEEPLLVNGVSFRLVKLSTKEKPCCVEQSPSVCLAYAMQTSGTTGQPKIVFVPHQCVVPNVIHLRWVLHVFGIKMIKSSWKNWSVI